MSEEREQQKVAYLRRSYAAVDGLWFVKLEEELGFERALEFAAVIDVDAFPFAEGVERGCACFAVTVARVACFNFAW